MSYFVDRNELMYEIERAVDAIFTAVGKSFSDEEREFNKKLKELRNEFLLIIDTVGQQSHQSKKRKIGEKHMSEDRRFEEILKELVDHILSTDDERAIILIDELEESVKKFTEERQKIERQLTNFQKRIEGFLAKEEKEKERKL